MDPLSENMPCTVHRPILDILADPVVSKYLPYLPSDAPCRYIAYCENNIYQEVELTVYTEHRNPFYEEDIFFELHNPPRIKIIFNESTVYYGYGIVVYRISDKHTDVFVMPTSPLSKDVDSNILVGDMS